MGAVVTVARRLIVAALLLHSVLLQPPGAASVSPRARDGVAPVTAPLHVSDLTFVDARHGWAVGSLCGATGTCVPALRATHDGGQTWQALPVPPLLLTSTTSTVRQVHFATTQDGWLFGPTLSATHDGGQTWTQDRRVRGVVALATAGRSVWVLSRSCAPFRPCQSRLVVSRDAGRTWRWAATPPPHQPGVVQLLHPSARVGWIAATALLVGTHDGGRTWTRLTDPCAADSTLGPFGQQFAAHGNRTLWALCGGEPSAGQQNKSVYVSGDGGRHWALTATTCFPWTRPLRGGCGRVPGSGYVSGLALSTPTHGWMVLQRGTLYGSHDGGHTWYPAIPYAQANGSDAGIGPMVFVDAQHGWLGALGRVFHTTDGGAAWRAVLLR